MQTFDVFISYRREDGAETAELLCDYLRKMGLRVFFDKKGGIETGHRFDDQIPEALAATPHYVLIGSPAAFRFREGEDWVRQEITLALKHYKKLGNRTITVLLPEGADIPQEDTLPEKLRPIVKFQIVKMTDPNPLETVLAAVTAVSHANLWHASHRWLENQKKPGGRFCNLRVEDSLLPSAAPDLPCNVSGEDFGNCDLQDAIRWETKHIYLYGEGGIGKTTSLLKLMNRAYEEKAYDENAAVPLFVELSAAPDTYGSLYCGGSSSYIRRSVYRQIRSNQPVSYVADAAVETLDSVFNQPYETVVAPLDKLLSQPTEEPKYLLLLDGLNEISTVRIEENGPTVAEMVMEEILHLSRNYPGVRILLTGRSRERSLEEGFLPLELAGVSENVIYNYLAQKNCSTKLSEELLEILQIPLFLIMYAELSSGDGICTRGEILHRYFAHRKSGEYTLLTHVDDTQRSMKKNASAAAKDRIDPQLYRFLLDFILPEIGWYMEQKEIFYIPGCYLYEVIWNVLANRAATDICGSLGMHLFYPDVTTAAVADTLMQRAGNDPRQVCEKITHLLTFTLGVLRPGERGYHFVHQHIRDYFAARKYINALTLATGLYDIGNKTLAYDYMESLFGARPLDLVVRRFVGEILQEHRNIPVESENGWFLPEFTAERELITRAMDIYRDVIPGGKGIAALLDILLAVRKNLAGCDFSDLDLTECRLGGAALRMGDLEAEFARTCLRGETLLHTGHTGYVTTVTYSPDGSYVLTGGDDGKVLRYDTATGKCQQLAQLPESVWFARLLSDGTLLTVCESRNRYQFFFGCENMIIRRINPQTEKQTHYLELSEGFQDVQLSADEKLLLICRQSTLYILCAQTLELLHQYQLEKKNDIAVFLGKTYDILLSDGSVIHALTGQMRKFLPIGEQNRYITQAAVYGSSVCVMTDEAKNLVRLELYRLKDGKLLQSFLQEYNGLSRFDPKAVNHDPKRFINLTFSDRGKWLVLTLPNAVFIYETKTWQLYITLPHMLGEYINAVAFFDENRRMAVGTLRGGVYLCETAAFTPVVSARGILCRVRRLDISPDGTYMTTLSTDGMLRCWNLQTGILVAARHVPGTIDRELDITRDGQLVQLGGRDGCCYSLPGLEPFSGVRIQPGYSLVENNGDGQIWVCRDGICQYTVPGNAGWLCNTCLLTREWTAEGFYQACYAIESGKLLWRQATAPFLLIDSTDRFLVISREEKIETLSCATGEILGTTEKDMHPRFIHRDHLYVHEGYYKDHYTQVYRLPELTLVSEVPGHITFSPDGKWVQVENVGQFGMGKWELYQYANRTRVASFNLIADELITGFGSNHTYVPVKNDRFAVCSTEETVCVYQLEEDASCRLIGEYTVIAGLDVLNIDLSDLHPDSSISAHQEQTLRINGAIL